MIETAWVAGLLEGEGCFRRDKSSIRIVCGMTDRDVVERLLVLGGKVRSKTRPPHQTLWIWEVGGDDAAKVMRSILPFMGERRSHKINEILQARADYEQRRDAVKERNMKIQELRSSGMLQQEIADTLGCSQSTVSQVLRQCQ